MKAKIAHKTLKLKQNFTLLLLVALVCSLMAFSITAIADAETPTAGDQPVTLAEETPEETPGDATKGMEINKTAKLNDDGTYQITLEAYATGEKTVTTVKKDVPTDIVLVIDQSGSMSYSIDKTGYYAYSGDNRKNSYLYAQRHNNDGNENLWYNKGTDEDPEYVSVSVILTLNPDYDGGHDESWGHDNFYGNRNNLFALVNGEYQKVSVVETGRFIVAIEYEYRLPGGTVIATASLSLDGWSLDGISNTDDGKLYIRTLDESKSVYDYYYMVDDVQTKICTSTGADTLVTEKTFYAKLSAGDGTEPRLDALMRAAQQFANNVNTKAMGADGEYGTADDINHRIAVVGFSSNESRFNNTELLTGVTITTGTTNYGTDPVDDNSNLCYYPTGYAKNGVQYGSITDDQYKKALQSMNTEAGKGNVDTAIAALTAHGGTQTNHGIDMANEIFKNNPLKEGEKRNRVIVLFTDGIPTGNSSTYSSTVATNAINNATTAKNTYGATVYAIGLFEGANATSAGSTGDGASDASRGNYVCQQISSNNGTPPEEGAPSYYLTAGDSGSLNTIFQQISGQIQNDPTTTTLDENAVIKDIIAPQFQLPAGATAANITLETYAYTAANTWTKNDTAMGATATVNATTGNVDVTGFDFAENWCGTETSDGNATYRGNKLVIKFNVQTKPGFLGGNDVYTNTSAGVYENADATEPVLTFPKPTVNVPIGAVAVTAADKNVYLLGSLTAEQIKSGATATCGGVSLNLAADNNYGLEPWQTDYVNITVTYKDASGNTITNVSDLKDDTTYTVAVTVTPKTVTPVSTQGETATTQTNSAAGNIKVFKPELTFKDSTVYYGDNAPTDYSGNKTGEVWKHGETTSTDTGVTMTGTAPTLALTYTPANGVKDGKIAVKTDIPVDVTVKIGEGDAATDVTNKTTFNHTKCNTNEANPTDGKFWLHVNTCSLTITKAAGIDTKTEEKVSFGTNESFVFNVYKDNNLYTQLTITGTGSVIIKELPVGNYTVAEDTSWSWRYNPTITGSGNLTAASPTGTITCTNNLTTKQWLNGFSAIVKNVFGAKQAQ